VEDPSSVVFVGQETRDEKEKTLRQRDGNEVFCIIFFFTKKF
jgi:hypothetical protein